MGGEGDDRGWEGWMASPTWWTWVWVGSGSWWWTGRPGVLQPMGSQRVGHHWAIELNWAERGLPSSYLQGLPQLKLSVLRSAQFCFLWAPPPTLGGHVSLTICWCVESVCLSVSWREGSQSLKEWIILLLPPINPQLALNPPAFQFPTETSWSHVTLVFCVFCLLCSLNAWFTFSQWCQRIARGAFSLVSIRLSKPTSNQKRPYCWTKQWVFYPWDINSIFIQCYSF